ncbi:hypothetical protein MTX78_10675 [Hymenobacter tibetensis]|uniref:OmpH family outer membrane protein n=1 Tax=Hymenobacter tibetensis TaxID=497967 RepID=A0ABY4D3N7_9BACT|nr:hypothetical protein [Hymenobacter tibetensis]UOG77045.1 hypothetical protein MTX78_10675 [Hymenobacter tibetensis]
MKNIFTPLVFALIVGSVQLAEAGSGDQNRTTDRATQMTKQLAQKTQLSEGQYVKVRQLNVRMLNEVQETKARLASDPAALDQKLAEMQAHYEWDLATILWPRQMAVYTQSKADLMAFSAR